MFIPAPKYAVNVEHGVGSSIIEINVEDGELVKATLKCRNGEAPLQLGANTVKNCVLPATVELVLRKQGFIHRYRRDVVIPRLLDKILGAIEPGQHEVVVGGFVLKYSAPPYPDILPISRLRAVIDVNVELAFKSKVAGRVVVVSQSGVKWHQVRPGENSVLAPGFNDTYYLVFDTGYSRYVYRVEIPITAQLQVAEAQAKNLLRELRMRGFK